MNFVALCWDLSMVNVNRMNINSKRKVCQCAFDHCLRTLEESIIYKYFPPIHRRELKFIYLYYLFSVNYGGQKSQIVIVNDI